MGGYGGGYGGGGGGYGGGGGGGYGGGGGGGGEGFSLAKLQADAKQYPYYTIAAICGTAAVAFFVVYLIMDGNDSAAGCCMFEWEDPTPIVHKSKDKALTALCHDNHESETGDSTATTTRRILSYLGDAIAGQPRDLAAATTATSTVTQAACAATDTTCTAHCTGACTAAFPTATFTQSTYKCSFPPAAGILKGDQTNSPVSLTCTGGKPPATSDAQWAGVGTAITATLGDGCGTTTMTEAPLQCGVKSCAGLTAKCCATTDKRCKAFGVEANSLPAHTGDVKWKLVTGSPGSRGLLQAASIGALAGFDGLGQKRDCWCAGTVQRQADTSVAVVPDNSGCISATSPHAAEPCANFPSTPPTCTRRLQAPADQEQYLPEEEDLSQRQLAADEEEDGDLDEEDLSQRQLTATTRTLTATAAATVTNNDPDCTPLQVCIATCVNAATRGYRGGRTCKSVKQWKTISMYVMIIGVVVAMGAYYYQGQELERMGMSGAGGGGGGGYGGQQRAIGGGGGYGGRGGGGGGRAYQQQYA